MQYPEFKELLQCLNYWYQVFVQYDTNRTGYMEANELGRCIQQRLRMCYHENETNILQFVLMRTYTQKQLPISKITQTNDPMTIAHWDI